MHYFLGIVMWLMLLIVFFASPIYLALFPVFIILSGLAVQFSAKLVKKSKPLLASCVRAVIYSCATLVVVATFASPVNLTSPLGKLLAPHHWRAGEPTDGNLRPDKLFVIICAADKKNHIEINNLQQLASLQKGAESPDDYPCIKKHSFRLEQPSGNYDIPFIEEGEVEKDAPVDHVSFQVVKESGAVQIVEVHYEHWMNDIVDSLFRYEVKDGKVNPLESWVLPRVMVGIFGEFVLLILIMLLFVGIRALLRMYRQRGKKVEDSL